MFSKKGKIEWHEINCHLFPIMARSCLESSIEGLVDVLINTNCPNAFTVKKDDGPEKQHSISVNILKSSDDIFGSTQWVVYACGVFPRFLSSMFKAKEQPTPLQKQTKTVTEEDQMTQTLIRVMKNVQLAVCAFLPIKDATPGHVTLEKDMGDVMIQSYSMAILGLLFMDPSYVHRVASEKKSVEVRAPLMDTVLELTGVASVCQVTGSSNVYYTDLFKSCGILDSFVIKDVVTNVTLAFAWLCGNGDKIGNGGCIDFLRPLMLRADDEEEGVEEERLGFIATAIIVGSLVISRKYMFDSDSRLLAMDVAAFFTLLTQTVESTALVMTDGKRTCPKTRLSKPLAKHFLHTFTGEVTSGHGDCHCMASILLKTYSKRCKRKSSIRAFVLDTMCTCEDYAYFFTPMPSVPRFRELVQKVGPEGLFNGALLKQTISGSMFVCVGEDLFSFQDDNDDDEKNSFSALQVSRKLICSMVSASTDVTLTNDVPITDLTQQVVMLRDIFTRITCPDDDEEGEVAPFAIVMLYFFLCRYVDVFDQAYKQGRRIKTKIGLLVKPELYL